MWLVLDSCLRRNDKVPQHSVIPVKTGIQKISNIFG